MTWVTCMKYFHNINGHQIAAEHDKLGVVGESFAVASQIFPLGTADNNDMPLYDCYLYYKMWKEVKKE